MEGIVISIKIGLFSCLFVTGFIAVCWTINIIRSAYSHFQLMNTFDNLNVWDSDNNGPN